jgi:hypothetical protein
MPLNPKLAAQLQISGKELNGLASPANCAKNMPGPLICFIGLLLNSDGGKVEVMPFRLILVRLHHVHAN